MLRPQFTVLDVHLKPLREPAHREDGEVGAAGVDVAEVMPGLGGAAAAVQDQAAVRARERFERGGETGLREREADADVAPVLVPARLPGRAGGRAASGRASSPGAPTPMVMSVFR